MTLSSATNISAPDRLPHPEASGTGDGGFTLLEMIVVVTLLGIMMTVAIPRLTTGMLSDGGDETARWIIANVRQLKEKAISDQKTYLLNVSLDTGQMWTAPADLAETEAATARDKGYRLPRGVRFDHVAFSENERFTNGTVPIGFYPQGYSDKAVIRLRDKDGDRLAFFIEPFLSRVNLVRGSEGW